MPLSLPLHEPTSADYVFIGEDGFVHLLLPIVGGETIGLDNTCQSAVELKTFFYGSHGKKSCDVVLREYAAALLLDIEFLSVSGLDPALLKTKQGRRNQIIGYQLLLREVGDNFTALSGSYPSYPEGVTHLLRRKTNCFSMRLSTSPEDLALRLEVPTFSLARNPRVMDGHGFLIPQPPDSYRGLGPKLRAQLSEGLLLPRAGVTSPKEITFSLMYCVVSLCAFV